MGLGRLGLRAFRALGLEFRIKDLGFSNLGLRSRLKGSFQRSVKGSRRATT